jgi:serine/threonine protein kinase
LTGTDDGVDSSPTHPFGNTEMARLVNIPNTKNEVYQKTWIPKGISNRKATDLIKQMIQFNEKYRPTLSQILENAYFQPATKEVYPIYTYDKPGLCVIFNQELFTKVYNKSSKKFILT